MFCVLFRVHVHVFVIALSSPPRYYRRPVWHTPLYLPSVWPWSLTFPHQSESPLLHLLVPCTQIVPTSSFPNGRVCFFCYHYTASSSYLALRPNFPASDVGTSELDFFLRAQGFLPLTLTGPTPVLSSFFRREPGKIFLHPIFPTPFP